MQSKLPLQMACLFGVLLMGLQSMTLRAADCESPVTVHSGDTLSEIAARCGTTVAALLVNNPQIDESGAVRVGERVYLPPPGSALSAQALEQLVAPIALHPDVLLAEMLPASTYPLAIVQAARWREDHPHAEAGEQQDWPDSVKALTRYPDVLAQMDEDIAWTQQLGDAFLSQPDEVFAAIQRLRQIADANGRLPDNDVQDIVREPASTSSETIIRIVHADPYYVHVPRYDSHYIYDSHHSHSVGLHFGAGLLLGGWLHHTLDWHHRHLFYQPYHGSSYYRYYRYKHYRPYYSYNAYRDVRSPYRGKRWRHQPKYYDRYHHNRGHYRNARRHTLQRYSAHRPVERRDFRSTRQHDRDGSVRHQDQRTVSALSGRNPSGERQQNPSSRPDMNTRAWKGSRSSAVQSGRSIRSERSATASNANQSASSRMAPQPRLKRSPSHTSTRRPVQRNQNRALRGDRGEPARRVSQPVIRNERPVQHRSFDRQQPAVHQASNRSNSRQLQTQRRVPQAGNRSGRQRRGAVNQPRRLR